MLAGLSESLTLTLILILVFGSACLYLYTKITQAEQKISLIESILLDLKMASDLRNMGGSDAYGDEKEVDEQSHMGRSGGIQMSNDVEYAGDFGGMSRTAADDKPEEDFSDVLQSAHAQASHMNAPIDDFEELKSDTSESAPAFVPDAAPASATPVEPNVALATADLSTEATSSIGSAQIDSNDIPFESLDSSSGSSQQPNLESMTAKELHSLAKQRGVSGESKMTRAQLIESLR